MVKKDKILEKVRKIINRETNYWCEAHPKKALVLHKFAEKIKSDIELEV